ncbi:hypothetical protein Hdeb2414_s0010g00341801 [Helianthus debilis subsp. tardiflorus]
MMIVEVLDVGVTTVVTGVPLLTMTPSEPSQPAATVGWMSMFQFTFSSDRDMLQIFFCVRVRSQFGSTRSNRVDSVNTQSTQFGNTSQRLGSDLFRDIFDSVWHTSVQFRSTRFILVNPVRVEFCSMCGSTELNVVNSKTR